MGRTLKELREAKGLTYESLAVRINSHIRRRIEAVLRERGEDMRVVWRWRDMLLERLSVDAKTVERWEKVGFGVQWDTRAAGEFYDGLTFKALVEVLDIEPGDIDSESSNATLQPGDTVVRTKDDGIVRFLVVPDGYGDMLLKEEKDITDADYEAIRAYREEEIAFLEAKEVEAIDTVARHEAANLDAELEALSDDQEER